MYSNLAGILLNSVPVLPSSASLPELGRVLRIPAGLQPVLQELGGDWKVLLKLDSITLPHLRRLTSLTLHNYPTSETDLDGVYAGMAESSHPDEIWAILKTTNVRLNGIDVNHISTALLNYISSYSGLKKLCLAPLNFETRGESDPATDQFYNLCLGKHMSSLEEFIVMARYEGGWCLGDQALMVISLCKKLKILEGSLILGALDDAVVS